MPKRQLERTRITLFQKTDEPNGEGNELQVGYLYSYNTALIAMLPRAEVDLF